MCDNGFAAQLKLNRFFPPSSPPHSRFFDPPPLIYSHFSSHLHTHICSSNAYGYRRPPQHSIFSFTTPPNAFFHPDNKPVRGGFSTRAAAPRQSPYQVLGVSPSATPDDIKRAYRKLALKYHPDVNKEPGAQEKFMRIKHAYNTLLDSKSRGNYDQDGRSFDYSYTQRNRTTRNSPVKEDFYGLGEFIRDVQLTLADFFRDVQEEFRNWETSASSQGKPKSLWEELSEIGEEFVEFLEKELNITDSEDKADFSGGGSQKDNLGADPSGSNMKNEAGKNISIEDNIDEIEATLAQLKKDLGL